MRKIIFLSLTALTLIYANNFRDGMLSYKSGDFKKAKKSFELALNKDHVELANFMLGKIYLYGKGVPPQKDKAMKYLGKASRNGNIRAGCYLSEIYLKNNINKDEAVVLLKKGLTKNLQECKKVQKIYNIKIEKGTIK